VTGKWINIAGVCSSYWSGYKLQWFRDGHITLLANQDVHLPHSTDFRPDRCDIMHQDPSINVQAELFSGKKHARFVAVFVAVFS
jgi:hypothetical protein